MNRRARTFAPRLATSAAARGLLASALLASTPACTVDAPAAPSLPAVDGGARDAASNATPGDADAAAADASAPPGSAKARCAALLACVADVEPALAGGLVALYGDASPCWRGSEGDADACGAACDAELARHAACTAAPVDASYLALCEPPDGSLAPALAFDVPLVFDARTGGAATLRPLPARATTYEPSAALASFPMALRVEAGGGAGELASVALPLAALDPRATAASGTAPLRALRLRNLRADDDRFCADYEVETERGDDAGRCVFFPLAPGAAYPADYRARLACPR